MPPSSFSTFLLATLGVSFSAAVRSKSPVLCSCFLYGVDPFEFPCGNCGKSHSLPITWYFISWFCSVMTNYQHDFVAAHSLPNGALHGASFLSQQRVKYDLARKLISFC